MKKISGSPIPAQEIRKTKMLNKKELAEKVARMLGLLWDGA